MIYNVEIVHIIVRVTCKPEFWEQNLLLLNTYILIVASCTQNCVFFVFFFFGGGGGGGKSSVLWLEISLLWLCSFLVANFGLGWCICSAMKCNCNQ